MDCITKTLFQDGRMRVSDGTQVRVLRLDELLDETNKWGLRVQVYEFQTTSEAAFFDSQTKTYGLYANPTWWELVASKEELEEGPDIYWFGEKVITYINGEMVILPLLARVGDMFGGSQTESLLEAVGTIAAAFRRSLTSADEDFGDQEIAKELGVTVKLLHQGEAYYRQIIDQQNILTEGVYDDDTDEYETS